MVPATYIFSAIPLNCINALILANVLNPVEVSKEEDVVYSPSKHEKDFFSTISNSMLVGMNMVIVILAMVIGYGFNSMFKWDFRIFVTGLTIQKSSIIFSPFAFYSVYRAVMLCM